MCIERLGRQGVPKEDTTKMLGGGLKCVVHFSIGLVQPPTMENHT